MSQDQRLADLLGRPPAESDPGFRYDVLASVAARARRRAAFRRASAYASAFVAFGLSVPLARASGITAEQLQPMLMSAGGVALAYLAAVLAIRGPGGALASVRVLLRAHP
jgi:hypothetical protein